MEPHIVSIVSLQQIRKSFSNTTVLKKINLDLAEGAFTAILGSSGSGKTTLLRLIAGLEKPDTGTIHINGRLVSKDNRILVPPAQRETGFIFQDLALWPHLTVYENIALGLRIKTNRQEADIAATIAKMLEFFGIAEHQHKYPGQLSGGQQQLVAIARSLALEPKLLLMDEPLANLDVKLKVRIRKQIKNLTRQFSVSIIYVTHDHLEAFNLADEIVVIDSGRVIESGTPEDIKNSQNTFVREFIEV